MEDIEAKLFDIRLQMFSFKIANKRDRMKFKYFTIYFDDVIFLCDPSDGCEFRDLFICWLGYDRDFPLKAKAS